MGGASVHQVSQGQNQECVARPSFKLEHNVDLIAPKENQITPSPLHPDPGWFQFASLLLCYGAKLDIGKNGDETSLYQETEGEYYSDYVDTVLHSINEIMTYQK